jgi:pimeloyl-ACP methyl ester carboxylesterase
MPDFNASAPAFCSSLERFHQSDPSRGSDSRGPDHDYGNWSKKARSYASSLSSANRWLTKNKAVIRGDQHIGSSKQMVFECISLSRGEVRWCFFATGFRNRGIPWRHQLSALSAAGFRTVAPDMRGYGQTDRPEAIDQYTLLHLVGDMVGLLDALNQETAVIAGHDWGAPVAWHAALLRPDRFRAVIGLSVPFIPRSSDYPSKSFPQTDDTVFYQSYFQSPGVAEGGSRAQRAVYYARASLRIRSSNSQSSAPTWRRLRVV